LVTVRGPRPRPGVDRQAGAGAEGLAELVAQIGGDAAGADEPLVDEGEIAERDAVVGKPAVRGHERGRDQRSGADITQAAKELMRDHLVSCGDSVTVCSGGDN
jgi:hypothetical protein